MKHQIWAHRGASGYMPENTLLSFDLAAKQHADGVELDIQYTKDRKIVVIHDENIDRTSNGTGWVKDYTFAQLRTFNFNKTHPEAGHADIPLMQEVFDLLKPTNLMINIELKTGIFDYEGIEEEIIEMVKANGFQDRVIYSSFNHYSALKVRQLDPNAKVAFLYEDGPIDMPEYAHKYGMNAIHPAVYNLRYQDVVEKAHQLGMAVNVWTVNDETLWAYCDKMKADAVITNYPDKARIFFEEHA